MARACVRRGRRVARDRAHAGIALGIGARAEGLEDDDDDDGAGPGVVAEVRDYPSMHESRRARARGGGARARGVRRAMTRGVTLHVLERDDATPVGVLRAGGCSARRQLREQGTKQASHERYERLVDVRARGETPPNCDAIVRGERGRHAKR